MMCANECFERGEMLRSQKQAVITLIEKKGKATGDRFHCIG